MPIQNICWSPTSTSYLRTKSSLPSVPIRNTDKHAGTVRIVAAVPDRQAHDVRRDQQPAARIDVEGAAMDAARIDMLDRVGFAGRRVDREYRERVLATGKDALGPSPTVLDARLAT